MKVVVDGKEAPYGSITYRDLGFSESIGDAGLSYEAEIKWSEFSQRFGDRYATFIDDCRQDDQETGFPDPAYLASLGYPSLQDMHSRHKAELSHLLQHIMFFDVLQCCFPNMPLEPVNFVINSIDAIEVRDDALSIKGLGYKPRPQN